MKAFLLCAGYGKRLSPITDNLPKCLVKICDKELLAIWIEKLKKIGIDHIFINTHYLSEKIIIFLEKNNYFDIKIEVLHEEKLYGTAGSLIKNINKFNDDSLLFAHSDNIFDESLDNFINFHNRKTNQYKFSMFLFKTNDYKTCGMAKVDNSNVLIEFEEKPNYSTSSLANGAIYILDKDLIKNITTNLKIKDFSKEIIPKYIGKINCYISENFFIDIGNAKALEIANNYFSNN